jgi:hypothetical protein
MARAKDIEALMGPRSRRLHPLGRATRPGGFGGSGPPGVSLSAARARVRLDRSQKTPSNQLIQPGRSNICHYSLVQMWKAATPRRGILLSALAFQTFGRQNGPSFLRASILAKATTSGRSANP